MDPEKIETVSIYPVKNETEDDWDMVLRIKDITEERLFEKKVIQNEKMIALGMMTSSIAHEIKNPIGFISFNVPILRDFITEMMPVIDEHARKQPEFEIFNMSYDEFYENIFNLLDNIEHGSARIETFVTNLKEFTRLSYDVDEKWMDLNTVIESVVQMNREHLLKKVKLFEKDVPENLPKIWSDPNAIEQILLNLLHNAVQASNKENSKVVLHVEVRRNWLSHLILEVSDNGTGMDADTRNRIFDPFFTTKSHASGMGLGLYICSGLVTNLGGRIEVESQPGEGSTFRVILPDRDRRSKKRFK
jgi:signal transduction histidine kinase